MKAEYYKNIKICTASDMRIARDCYADKKADSGGS
jgi:hypothetical protein